MEHSRFYLQDDFVKKYFMFNSSEVVYLISFVHFSLKITTAIGKKEELVSLTSITYILSTTQKGQNGNIM